MVRRDLSTDSTLEARTRREFLATCTFAAVSAAVTDSVTADETSNGKNNDQREKERAARRAARKVPVTGKEVAELRDYDKLLIDFVKEHRVPGASLAVMKSGRLVYARGFGEADRQADQPVQPDSLFRIASISKPITAVGVLRLVEEKKLKLSDKAFDLLDIEPHLEEGKEPDPRLADVTVLHLLQHTGGWDRNVSYDPMFRPVDIAKSLGVDPPAEPEHVIRYMLGQPLEFTPGERYAYSNFGYCVLGRIIERVSGKSYDEYIREDILARCGIREMRLGKTLLENRAPKEVKYYQRGTDPSVFAENLGEQVPLPYGAFYLEAMDSHGGWLSSSIDLLRFCAGLDARKLLSEASIAAMLACPAGAAGHEEDDREKDVFYGCGWSIRPGRNGNVMYMNHAGSLSGTSTLLTRRDDGLAWAILFNARNSRDGKSLSSLIDDPLHKLAGEVKKWPEHDLFDRYEA